MHEFIALSRLWHTKDERYYPAGAAVDLSHLDAGAIERLVAGRVVLPRGDYNELRRVRGIGEAYALALVEAGVRGVDDLLAADAHELARELASVSVATVERWQARAKARLEPATTDKES